MKSESSNSGNGISMMTVTLLPTTTTFENEIILSRQAVVATADNHF